MFVLISNNTNGFSTWDFRFAFGVSTGLQQDTTVKLIGMTTPSQCQDLLYTLSQISAHQQNPCCSLENEICHNASGLITSDQEYVQRMAEWLLIRLAKLRDYIHAFSLQTVNIEWTG